MTTTLPPTQFFTGIFYNANFWTSGTTALTQDIANTLYLEKTTPDTATALQTFSGGVSTQSMTAPSLTADVTLFPNQTAGTLKLATTARSVHCSNIDCQGNAINNASTPAAGALTIGASQTTGTIEIGKNASRTGAITIGHNNCTVNFGGHLTPTYTAMPSTGEIGANASNTYTGATLTLGTGVSLIGTAQSLTAGVWLITGNVQLPITVVGTVVTITLNTGTSINVAAAQSDAVAASALYLNVSLVISQTSTTSWGLYGQASIASTVLASARFNYTRLA
jgi:hypothetical protein